MIDQPQASRPKANWMRILRPRKSFTHFVEGFKDESALAAQIKDKPLLDEMLNRFDHMGYETWVLDTSSGRFFTMMQELKDYDLSETLMSLVGKVKGAVYSLRSNQLAASYLGVDPVIYNGNTFLHRWTTDRLLRDYGASRQPSSEEQAVAMGLTSKEVGFLAALSDDELRKLREHGNMEDLRRELRLARRELQSEAPETVLQASSRFARHLIDVVEAYGRDIEDAQRSASRRMTSSGLIFAGSAALGVSALALPQLALLGAAATGIGLAFGGKSVADVIRDHKEGREALAALERSPVSLLYGAYRNYHGDIDTGNRQN